VITPARILLIAGLIAGAVTGCSEFQVRTDYDRDTNFAALETYAWSSSRHLSTGSANVDSHMLEARVRASIDRVLTAKGYRVAPADEADFLVTFHSVVQRKLEATDLDGQRGYGAGLGRADDFGAAYGGGGGTGSIVEEYEEGTLAIGILPTNGGSPLWRGAARASLFDDATYQKRTARLERAVKRVLSKFPP